MQEIVFSFTKWKYDFKKLSLVFCTTNNKIVVDTKKINKNDET